MTEYAHLSGQNGILNYAPFLHEWTHLSFPGWYEGERLRDSERGWFPKEYVVEIVNSHVRARNLRMKYRLMQVSEHGDR